MKLLLDENVPAPMTSTVKILLRRSHDVQHVIDVPGWSGTKDLQLYAKAKEAGFQLVVTNDAKQMNRKSEVEAIAKSGPFEQDRMKRCRSAICQVRSETSLYLIGVIEAVVTYGLGIAFGKLT